MNRVIYFLVVTVFTVLSFNPVYAADRRDSFRDIEREKYVEECLYAYREIYVEVIRQISEVPYVEAASFLSNPTMVSTLKEIAQGYVDEDRIAAHLITLWGDRANGFSKVRRSEYVNYVSINACDTAVMHIPVKDIRIKWLVTALWYMDITARDFMTFRLGAFRNLPAEDLFTDGGRYVFRTRFVNILKH